eukprot:IDg15149t1
MHPPQARTDIAKSVRHRATSLTTRKISQRAGCAVELRPVSRTFSDCSFLAQIDRFATLPFCATTPALPV